MDDIVFDRSTSKYYVLKASASDSPKFIHVVGKRFEKYVDDDGLIKNKSYLIYNEIMPFVDCPENFIEKSYKEVASSDDIFCALCASYRNSRKTNL